MRSSSLRRTGAQRADDERREERVRPIARKYLERRMEGRRGRQMTAVVVENMKLGCSPDISPADTDGMSAAQRWSWAVGLLFKALGREQAAILLLRIVPSHGRGIGSFDRVTDVINDCRAGDAQLSVRDVQRIYYSALRRFCELLDETGLTIEVESAEHAPARRKRSIFDVRVAASIAIALRLIRRTRSMRRLALAS